jgi:Mlc titration factor MtfA (ptsG expression regulator)
MDPEYSLEMDMYLYQVVGYDRLNFIVSSYGLFTSAYSATAIREYFSNGFEYFFLDDRKYLKETCPVLYSKILEIYKEDESEY